MKIESAKLSFYREPLKAPFGFKGAYLTELWQVIVRINSQPGPGLGLGVQSVLWSDAEVFAVCGQERGNRLMLSITERALRLLEGRELCCPTDMIGEIFPYLYKYAQSLCGKADLRPTFVLNSLVPVDNALWQLWAMERGRPPFLELIPRHLRSPLSHKQDKLGCIPLVSYNTSASQIAELADEGAFLLKIKAGSDPDRDGDPDKMLRWDMERLTQIHELLHERKSQYTQSGHIMYYLDANGRYDSPQRLMRLLDHADRIGALERIAILEEPFPEGSGFDVSSIPVRFAADESAHSVEDALRLMELGYSALALKPVAKTLSVTLGILSAAQRENIPCFCADLTVNPALVEFNKNIAGRIAPLPGLKIGVLESNGGQNYKNWDKMCTFHPLYGRGYDFLPEKGIFPLDEQFYHHCGGIFLDAPEYERLLDLR